MKKIQNDTAKTLGVIHGTAFTAFFVVDKILTQIAYPAIEKRTSKVLMIALSAVIAVFLYSTVYYVVKKIYDVFLLKKEPKLNISGKWYHVHIPYYLDKPDYSQKRLSAGTTMVSRELKDFTFVGDNKKYSFNNGEIAVASENSTHWYTKATKLSEENDYDIIEIYEAKTKGDTEREVTSCPYCKNKFDVPIPVREVEPFRHGVHKINIVEENGQVSMMTASYSDCWPSLKCGELKFFKTEAERDECIKEFFAHSQQ